MKEAALDIKTWLWAAMMFSISVPSGGISTFGPLIVKNFGFDQFQTILLNMPFGAVQLIATLLGAWAATVIKWKSPVLAFLSLPPIAGCVMLLHLPRDASAKAPLLVAYYLVSPLQLELTIDTRTNIYRYLSILELVRVACVHLLSCY